MLNVPFSREPALGAWGVFWGAAIVFAVAATPGWFSELSSDRVSADQIASVVVVALALALILRPSRTTIALSALAVVAHVAIILPEAPNHRLILALGSIGLVLALATAKRERALEAFVPAARLLAVLVYAFAFFAKLNRDFVDPASSCAVEFYGHLSHWWGFWPAGPAMANAAIFLTLAIEGLLPFGLCWRPTRRLAILLGLAFHLVLGLDATQNLVNFSAVMTALLPVFLPMPFFAILAHRFDRERSLRRILAAGLLAIVASGLLAESDWARFAIVYYWIRQLVFTTYVLVLGTAVLGSWRVKEVDEAPHRRPSYAPVLVVGVLAALNGLSPYLGLKTRTAFDMYSNLRLEADRSNHWVVPRSLDLLGVLGDRVTVPETGEELTAFEYRRRTGEPPTGWMGKLLVFRPLGESSRAVCAW